MRHTAAVRERPRGRDFEAPAGSGSRCVRVRLPTTVRWRRSSA